MLLENTNQNNLYWPIFTLLIALVGWGIYEVRIKFF